jgi:hypothetical protein
MKFLEVEHTLHIDDPAKGFLLERRQEIPDEFMSMLKGIKADSTDQREGEFMHVAAVPEEVANLWLLRDNYDILKEDIRTTVKKLRAEGLDAFIVTNKRV